MKQHSTLIPIRHVAIGIRRIIAVVLIASLNGVGLMGVGNTVAFYNDTEASTGNIFTASMLDFRLSSSEYTSLIGPEVLGEKTGVTVAFPETGSLPMQYVVSATTTVPTTQPLCDELTVEAKRNGITTYSGAFSGLFVATSTEFGTWEFRFDLPPLASVPHGATCSLDVLFSAWRADTPTPLLSGYTDEERFTVSFTSRMVVLNEIYPAPPPGGGPDAPVAPNDREWIELYNNGSTPIDIAGWIVSEMAGGESPVEKFYTIVASGAGSNEMQPYGGAPTTIAPGDSLVLQFGTGANKLNNTGDTVRLYDDGSTLLDMHAYPATVNGKSHVRFPDGIGFWVDPEPTPGTENKVTIEDLRSAGFDEATIAMLLDLAALMDTKVSEPLPMTSGETENVSEGTQEKQTMSEDTGNTESDTSLESETLVDEMQSDAPLTEETKNDVSIEDPIEQVVAIREDEMLPPNPDPVTSSEEIISSDTEVTETIEDVLLDESGVENDEIVSDDQPAVIEKVLEEPTPINKEDQVSPDVIPDVEPDAN